MSHVGSRNPDKELGSSSSRRSEQNTHRRKPKASSPSPSQGINPSPGRISMDPTTGAMSIRVGGLPQSPITGLQKSHSGGTGSPPTKERPRASRNRSAGLRATRSGSSVGSSTSTESMQRYFENTGSVKMTPAPPDDSSDRLQPLQIGSGSPQRPATGGESPRPRQMGQTQAQQPSGSISIATTTHQRIPDTKDSSQASSSGSPLPQNLARGRKGSKARGPQAGFVGGLQSASKSMLAKIPISPLGDPLVSPVNITEASDGESSRTTTKTRPQSKSASGGQIQPRGEASERRQPCITSGENLRSRQRLTGPSSAPLRTSSELHIGPGDPQGTRIVGRPNAPPMTAHLVPSGFITLPAPPGGRRVSQSGPHPRNMPRPRDSKISLGIEAEFVIAAKDINFFRETRQSFATALAVGYNKEVPSPRPRMRESLRPWQSKDDYDKWSLIDDDSISLSQRSPWGIELVSPILWATPGSKWREDVEVVWRHLRRYYSINTNDDCATHVHISIIPWYSWGEVKRIAQAAIHFEPAFEVLVPPARRGNKFAKSLWLDSPWLVAKDNCRAELMDNIEEADFLNALLPLIQDGRDYCWNFLPLFDRGTIEFRKPPASTTAEEALSWAELAMSFVQACIKCKSTVELKKVPATVGGLRWFCSQSLEAGVNQPHRLQRIWADHDEKEALKPVPVTKGDLSNEWTQRTKRILNMKAEKDIQQVREFSRTAGKPPYW